MIIDDPSLKLSKKNSRKSEEKLYRNIPLNSKDFNKQKNRESARCSRIRKKLYLELLE